MYVFVSVVCLIGTAMRQPVNDGVVPVSAAPRSGLEMAENVYNWDMLSSKEMFIEIINASGCDNEKRRRMFGYILQQLGARDARVLTLYQYLTRRSASNIQGC